MNPGKVEFIGQESLPAGLTLACYQTETSWCGIVCRFKLSIIFFSLIHVPFSLPQNQLV